MRVLNHRTRTVVAFKAGRMKQLLRIARVVPLSKPRQEKIVLLRKNKVIAKLN